MFRSFEIDLPADTNVHNLYSLIVGTAKYGLRHGGTNEIGITGAIPTDGILPDRVSSLEIQGDPDNTSTIQVLDRNNANTGGKLLNSGDVYNRLSNRNTICLKDYLIKGGAASQELEVTIESI